MQDLLPEFLRLLASHLSWPSVLDARQTCRHWAAALDPLITHLRVPLTAPDGEQLAALLPAALDKFTGMTSVTLLLTYSTTAPSLQEALHAVGSKANITTVALCEVRGPLDTPRGYASDLQLWRLPSVTELKITSLSWSLAAIWQQVGSMQDLSTAAADAAANTASAGSSGGGSSSSSSSSSPSSRSSSPSSRSSSPSSRSCALRTLVIEFVPHGNRNITELFVSDWKPLLLPAFLPLTRLSTPLPGQYSSDGSVMHPLNAAHGAYLAALAAGLPLLESLTVAGAYEGGEGVFQRFRKLRELVCELGDAFRAPLVDLHLDQSDAPALRIAAAVTTLTRLELLSHPTAGLMSALLGSTPRGQHAFFKLEWLAHNTALRHLAAPLVPTGEDLAGLDGQLRSLTGYCMPSEELLRQVLLVGSELTSLTLYQTEPHLTPRSSQLGRVGRYMPVPSRPPAPLLHLHTLCLMADKNVAYTLADPAAFWSHLPALRSLKLQKVGLGFRGSGVIDGSRAVRVEGEHPDEAQGGLSDRLVMWVRDLPCRQLQQLELSCYYLVVEPAAAAAAASTAAGGRCVQQGQQDACGGGSSSSSGGGGVQQARDTLVSTSTQRQQESDASRAAEVTGFAGLSLADKRQREGGQDIPAERACHNPSSSSSSSDLSGLQVLALVDCCCLLLPAAQQAAASHTTTSSSSAPHTVQVASLRPLLEHLASPTHPQHSSSSSSLRSLTLHSVFLTVDALAAIAVLGDQLEELDVQAQFGHGEFGGLSGAAAAVAASSALSDIFASKLKQLRRLSLLLSEPPVVRGPCSKLPAGCLGQNRMLLMGVPVATADGQGTERVCLTLAVLLGCRALRRLQDLRLLLRVDADATDRCSCCSAAVPRADAWKGLLSLQHLQQCYIGMQYRNPRSAFEPEVCRECGEPARMTPTDHEDLRQGVIAMELSDADWEVHLATF